MTNKLDVNTIHQSLGPDSNPELTGVRNLPTGEVVRPNSFKGLPLTMSNEQLRDIQDAASLNNPMALFGNKVVEQMADELLRLRAGVARAKELREFWIKEMNAAYEYRNTSEELRWAARKVAADEILKGFEP